MIRLRKLILPLLLIASLSACTSQKRTSLPDVELGTKISPILHQLDSAGAIVAARVMDLSNNRELYATQIDEPFLPASNQKLQTAAAALDRFGPDHVFKTYLAIDGDDLWLIGTGDPACGDSRLETNRGRKQCRCSMIGRMPSKLAASLRSKASSIFMMARSTISDFVPPGARDI